MVEYTPNALDWENWIMCKNNRKAYLQIKYKIGYPSAVK